MACSPDRSHRALAATPPRRSRAPRPPRPGRDPHPSSLSGLVPPASPSETAPRVYTRDGLSAGGEASMPCQQAKRFGGESRCRDPRTVCTREMGFLTSAELYWDFLPKIASRVYTRDALSGKGRPPAFSQQGETRRRGKTMSGASSCVYTRGALSAGGRGWEEAGRPFSPAGRHRESRMTAGCSLQPPLQAVDHELRPSPVEHVLEALPNHAVRTAEAPRGVAPDVR